MSSFRVRAPTRADLAGGTLDLWPLYTLWGNARTLNVALDLWASVDFKISASKALRFLLQANGTSYDFVPGDEASWNMAPSSLRFPAKLIFEFLKDRTSFPRKSIAITLSSQAPIGSGLGGSSALAIALARGLSNSIGGFSRKSWRWDLFRWALDVEASFLRLPTGSQDYLASIFGGLNSFHSKPGGIVRETYSPKVFKELKERILILFSGEAHQSGLTNWEVFRSALEKDAQVLKGLSEIRTIAEELDMELRQPSVDWKRVGTFLWNDWRIRENIFQVTTPRLKKITSFLDTQKILGAKVCGAASGGSFLVLCESQNRDSLTSACKKMGISVFEASPTIRGVHVQRT